MIDLWYLNIKMITKQQLESLLTLMPISIVNEVMRFRNDEDRRLKFFGKLMVKKYHEWKGTEFKWSQWRVTNDGKPYYNDGGKFNISHSGDYVVVAFSDKEIGVDIERVTEFDVVSISHYFHPKEIEYIKKSQNSNYGFFKLWTRKEAYLKAIGKGIIDGLYNENCLPDELTNKGIWYIHSPLLISNYQTAICTPIPNCQIKVKELTKDSFGTNLFSESNRKLPNK